MITFVLLQIGGFNAVQVLAILIGFPLAILAIQQPTLQPNTCAIVISRKDLPFEILALKIPIKGIYTISQAQYHTVQEETNFSALGSSFWNECIFRLEKGN